MLILSTTSRVSFYFYLFIYSYFSITSCVSADIYLLKIGVLFKFSELLNNCAIDHCSSDREMVILLLTSDNLVITITSY